RTRLEQQIARGRGILDSRLRSVEDFESIRSARTKWAVFVEEMLNRLFTNGSLSREFEAAMGPINIMPSTAQQFDSLREEIRLKLTRLESIVERLELFSEPAAIPPIEITCSGNRRSHRVEEHSQP